LWGLKLSVVLYIFLMIFLNHCVDDIHILKLNVIILINKPFFHLCVYTDFSDFPIVAWLLKLAKTKRSQILIIAWSFPLSWRKDLLHLWTKNAHRGCLESSIFVKLILMKHWFPIGDIWINTPVVRINRIYEFLSYTYTLYALKV
jgi:hypothetical protein